MRANTNGDCIGTAPMQQSDWVGPQSRELTGFRCVISARPGFLIQDGWHRS